MSGISTTMAHMNNDDQRPSAVDNSHNHKGERLNEGPAHDHLALDGKDQRSHANTIEAALQKEQREKEEEEARANIRPTDIARSHGNEPSRGAKIDEQLQLEEEAELRRKGKI